MALKLGIGQYWKADSAIHALDPRVKLVCAVVAMAAGFSASIPAQLGLYAAFTLAVLLLSRVPAAKLAESLRPAIGLLAFLALFNLLFIGGGEPIFSLGPVGISREGLWAALLYTSRFALSLMLGSLILATTTQTRLADGLDAMLGPLSRIGLPGHELAMVFSLMLRFVPTLADETQAVIDAQTARAGGIAEGSMPARLRSVVPVVSAVFASSTRHASGVARALDARCYEPGEGRTHLHPLALGAADAVAVLATAAFVCALIWLR